MMESRPLDSIELGRLEDGFCISANPLANPLANSLKTPLLPKYSFLILVDPYVATYLWSGRAIYTVRHDGNPPS